MTRIAFSPDDQLVLTVSRDRTWRLFHREESGWAIFFFVVCKLFLTWGAPPIGYVPIAVDKSHARIIWDCSWAPDGRAFATASRDKTVELIFTSVDQGVGSLTPTVEIGQTMALSPWKPRQMDSSSRL